LVEYAQTPGISGRPWYAYDVPDDTRRGELVIDEYNRVAFVMQLTARYDGVTLEAQRLETILRAYRILRGAS
jgi:hypothetical protein